MYPRNFPELTLKEHLDALRCSLCSLNTKSLSQIGQMLFYPLTLNYHIINVSLHVPPNLCFEHPRHYSLISESCVFKAEGHHTIIIVPIWGTKCCLLLVGQ